MEGRHDWLIPEMCLEPLLCAQRWRSTLNVREIRVEVRAKVISYKELGPHFGREGATAGF